MPTELKTMDEFEAAKKDDKLLVIDFTATWCPPCQMVAPKYAELAEQVKDYATLVKVDVDEGEDIA